MLGFDKSSIGRLFLTIVCAALGFGAQRVAVFAQSTGFFFGGGGAYLWEAVTSKDLSDRNYENKFQRSLEGFLYAGTSLRYLDLSLEAGIEPKTYYLRDSGEYKDINYTHIPIVFKAYYNSGGSLAIKPNVFGGAALDITPGEPDTKDAFGDIRPGSDSTVNWGVNFGAGLDLALAFPGDHISLFAGISYMAYIPVTYEGEKLWYHYPLVRGGVHIYPFSSGGSSVKSGGGIPRSAPVTTRIIAQAPQNNGTGNELLNTVRQNEPAQKTASAPPPAPRQAAPVPPAPPSAPLKDEKAVKALEETRAEISEMKKDIERQLSVLSNVGDNAPADKNTLESLKKTTNGVKTIQLIGGAEDNPVSPGAKLDTVYFFPDMSKPLIMYSIPIVDEVGKRLQSDNALIVAIRGYSAPAGSVEGQMIVSESRARYCAEYLNKNFGIAYDRMTIEWFGALRRPQTTQAYKEEALHRAVELVVKPKAQSPKTNVEISQVKQTGTKQ